VYEGMFYIHQILGTRLHRIIVQSYSVTVP